MARTLKVLLWAAGVVIVAIGVLHIALGIDSVPGERGAGATVDSRERFYGAIFLGYGLAWIWAARRAPVPASAVRWLAGILFLGGLARLISIADEGQPQVFQVVLTVIELVVPPLFFWLAPADERVRSAVGGAAHAAPVVPGTLPG